MREPRRRLPAILEMAAGAGGSALLLGLAFCPMASLPERLETLVPVGFALCGPVPLLLLLARRGGAGVGFWFGVLLACTTSAWLIDCYPGLGAIAFGMVLAFSGLLTAPLGWALGRLRERHGARAMLLWSPAVWCAWELFRAIPPLGSPWCSLAHALWRCTILLQVCDLAGFGPLSFLLASFAAGLALRLRGDRAARRPMAWALALISSCAIYGVIRLSTFETALGEPVQVALVQEYTPKELKRPGHAERLFWAHHDATATVAQGTDLVLWPETAVPGKFLTWPWADRAIRRLASDRGATIVAGGTGPVRGQPTGRGQTSCAFVVGPDGRLWDTAKKVHLVIFAEYTPGRRWLPDRLTSLTEQFTAGERYRAVDSPVGRLAVPICYESVFPGDVRRMVRDGAELLCVVTNDDQLGQWGARQHFQQAVFRCVEERRWMARCANSGISATIDPYGQVTSASGWAEKVVHYGTVWPSSAVTVYQYLGETFRIGLCVVVGWRLFRRRDRRS